MPVFHDFVLVAALRARRIMYVSVDVCVRGAFATHVFVCGNHSTNVS